MRRSSYLLLLISVALFLHLFNSLPTTRSSKELTEYMSIFKYEMESRGVKLDYSDLKLGFSDSIDYPNAVGLYVPTPATNYIVILQNYYSKASPEVQEALIAHELGHAFGLEHDDKMAFLFPSNCPYTVMHSSDSMENCFHKYRKYYYDILAEEIKRLDAYTE